MRAQYDHEYPPSAWTVDDLAETLEATDRLFPVPTYDDGGAWDRITRDDLTGQVASRILSRAAPMRENPVPQLPASLYLDYTRTGARDRYQVRERERLLRLSWFTLAECLERQGRFLDPILDHAWALCEQSTWLLPAHLSDEEPDDVERELPREVPPTERYVALRSSGIAKTLAELDYVLGDRLHPALRERIRTEVEERVFAPYEARDDFWWMTTTNNWNAVCNANVVIAALYLIEDVERQARLIHRAVGSFRHYLEGFDPDGCTAEGIQYWNYGFGHYVQVAAHLGTRTDGEYDLSAVPIVENIATYPLEIELSPGHSVPFSDAYERTWPTPYAACQLAERFDVPGLGARGRDAITATDVLGEKPAVLLRTLAWCVGMPDWNPPDHSNRRYLSGHQWWISRADPGDPEALVVAAKGGHNDESHNHNDCGSFVVHRNQESLLTDLGRQNYDAEYFGQARYESLVARSLGHSVPYVNGYEQATGAQYGAELVDTTACPEFDSITLELASCYPDGAAVESLRREITLDRERELVRIVDDATFETDGGCDTDDRFESVLVSFHPMSRTGDRIEVQGDSSAATIVPESSTTITLDHLEDAVDRSTTGVADREFTDVWRARIQSESGRDVGVSIEVTF